MGQSMLPRRWNNSVPTMPVKVNVKKRRRHRCLDRQRGERFESRG
jgi:hypothetical protein